jgi:hypothetical protein
MSVTSRPERPTHMARKPIAAIAGALVCVKG